MRGVVKCPFDFELYMPGFDISLGSPFARVPFWNVLFWRSKRYFFSSLRCFINHIYLVFFCTFVFRSKYWVYPFTGSRIWWQHRSRAWLLRPFSFLTPARICLVSASTIAWEFRLHRYSVLFCFVYLNSVSRRAPFRCLKAIVVWECLGGKSLKRHGFGIGSFLAFYFFSIDKFRALDFVNRIFLFVCFETQIINSAFHDSAFDSLFD